MMKLKAFDAYAKLVLRLGIAGLFLWFGSNQLLFVEDFLGYLPSFLLKSDFATTAVILNGIFELVLGLLLFAGYFTRLVAALLAVHLLGITFTLGYNDIAVRDLALAVATSSLALGGADKWTVDKRKEVRS